MAKKYTNIQTIITDVKVYKIKNGGNLKANVSICFNNELVVYAKLIESSKGNLFLSYPNHSYQEGKNTKWKDDVYPLTGEFANYVTDMVIEAYEE